MQAQGEDCRGSAAHSGGAAGSVESANTAQIHEGSVRDDRLFAHPHVERFDPAQVHKGRVRDGRLVAEVHVKLLDSTKVHEGRICDPAALTYVQSVQPCTRVALNMNEVRIDYRFAPIPLL